MEEKRYWKSLAEKNQDPQFLADSHKEFAEKLPLLDSLKESIPEVATGRRDFLKFLGFSVSAATVAAGCEMPVRKSIPYIFKPEEITPGVATFYASSYEEAGHYCSVLVKCREGRPIKIEGNPQSPITQGGTSARVQASVLDLYNANRFRTPLKQAAESDWASVDKEIAAGLKKASEAGKKIVLLTSSSSSPSRKRLVEEVKAKYPTFEWVVRDDISYSGIIEANEAAFGKAVVPTYHFDKAKVIVSIGADFLGTWVSPIEFTKDYSKTRKVNAKHRKMSKHFQIESIPTISGASSDERIPVMPADEELAVLSLYNLIAGMAGEEKLNSGSFNGEERIAAVARSLWASRGAALVVSGSNSKSVQLIVNKINDMLGSYGQTIDLNKANNSISGIDSKVKALRDDLQAGQVGALLIGDTNPVYNSTFANEFAPELEKLETSVSFASRTDETASSCKYVCPTHHYLESWGDAEPQTGLFSTCQPTISPLFKTRQLEESLMHWCGIEGTYLDFIKSTWQAGPFAAQSDFSNFDLFWDKVLHDGCFAVEAAEGEPTAFAYENLSEDAGRVRATAASGDTFQLKVYEKVAMGDGRFSDNPWLQEVPDPISKICWDNYFLVNPKWLEEQGLDINSQFKIFPTVKVTSETHELTLPAVAMPGVPHGAFGLAYGYGRTVVSNDEFVRGGNASSFTIERDGNLHALIGNVQVENATETVQLASTQMHHSIKHEGLGGEKTRKVVKETTLAEYKTNPHAGNEDRELIMHHMQTLYPGHDSPGHHWGMTIDLNTCTGCSACVVACQAENNISVVGSKEVARAHEMSWLRIDKYHTGDEENPDVVFQPMLCQHCDNAPCENVCPVAATNHNAEGLNQMAYNRCIGTRYCANNCPYKVRRFNWFDYGGADSFTEKNTIIDNYVSPYGMHDPVTRMVLNPDVTVRGRGVMEKCSFCVQKIQMGKLEAKKATRPLTDDDIQTACQSACPADAIVFGDTNNKESAVAKLRKDERAFGVIEEIHTLPSVEYLTKVRNRKKTTENA